MDRMGEAAGEYDLAGQVIGLAMRVHTTLGFGFFESVYKNALTVELRRAGCTVEREKPVQVQYLGETVGSFNCDILVNGVLLVEGKAVQAPVKAHEVQLVNYLTATGIDEGLLLNFGPSRLEFKKKFRQRESEPPSF
jgi:GxxExxY protein